MGNKFTLLIYFPSFSGLTLLSHYKTSPSAGKGKTHLHLIAILGQTDRQWTRRTAHIALRELIRVVVRNRSNNRRGQSLWRGWGQWNDFQPWNVDHVMSVPSPSDGGHDNTVISLVSRMRRTLNVIGYRGWGRPRQFARSLFIIVHLRRRLSRENKMLQWLAEERWFYSTNSWTNLLFSIISPITLLERYSVQGIVSVISFRRHAMTK